MKPVKIGILFVVLILGIVAFASTDEPEVDNVFALDSDSPIVSLLIYILSITINYISLRVVDFPIEG